jgi:hypothetical protein
VVLVDLLCLVPVFPSYVIKTGLARTNQGMELLFQLQFHFDLTRLQTATACNLQSGL